MKIIKKFTLLITCLSFSILHAQNTKKWHADDLYYSPTEKEIQYIEIIDEYSEDDYSDSTEYSYNDYDNSMSYSTRINRFHRDYYGTSIGFNYGWNDPFFYNNFGWNDPFFYNNFGWSSGFGPYYSFGWGYPSFGWYDPWYSPWYSPWNLNTFGWNGMYAFNPSFYSNSNAFASSNIHYGPRKNITKNVRSNSGNQFSRNQARQNIEGGNKTNSLAKRNSTNTSVRENKVNIPKNNKSRWDFSNRNTSQNKQNNKSSKNIISKPNTSKTRNIRKTSSYSPSRITNNFRSTGTNRSFTSPRSPRGPR